jgi:pyrroline-5-carboxylate reductase
MRGAAEMVLASPDSPETLREIGCSMGGTSERAVESFNENGFSDRIKAAMKACLSRAEDMEK